jgi:hypothetical protein
MSRRPAPAGRPAATRGSAGRGRVGRPGRGGGSTADGTAPVSRRAGNAADNAPQSVFSDPHCRISRSRFSRIDKY